MNVMVRIWNNDRYLDSIIGDLFEINLIPIANSAHPER
jgi:hypothetical protein